MVNDLGELLKKKKSAIEEPLNDYDYENKSFEEMTGYLDSGELPMRNEDVDTVDNSTDSLPSLFGKSNQQDNQEFEQEDNQEFEQDLEGQIDQDEPSVVQDEPSVNQDEPRIDQDIHVLLNYSKLISSNVEEIRERLINDELKHGPLDSITIIVDFLNVENNERKVVFEHELNKNIGDISVSDIIENNHKFLEHVSLKDIVPKVTFKEDKQELMVTMRYENVKPQEISLKNVHTHNIIDLEPIENDDKHEFDYIVRLSDDKCYGLYKDSLIQDGICQELNTNSTTEDVVNQLDESVLSDDNRDKLVERMRDFLNHSSSPDRLLPNSTQIGDYFDDNLTHTLPDDKSNIDDDFVQRVLDKLSKAKLDETDNTTFLEDVYDVAFECINQLREHAGLSEIESVDYHSLGISDEDTFKRDLIECLLLNSYSDTVEHFVEKEVVDDADNEAGGDNNFAHRLDDYIDVYNVNGSSTSRANGGLTISEIIFDHLVELLENDTFKNVITKDNLSLIDVILLNDESEIVSGKGIYEQFDYNVRNTSVVFLFN